MKIVEKPDKIMKEDFMSYLKSEKAKRLLDELWPYIKLDQDGRILYVNEDSFVAGSPLIDLIEYTTSENRSLLERPFDIKKFWSILSSNNVTDRVDRKWIKLVI